MWREVYEALVDALRIATVQSIADARRTAREYRSTPPDSRQANEADDADEADA